MSSTLGASLIDQVSSLAIPFLHERSIKFVQNDFIEDRFLLTLYLPALGTCRVKLLNELACFLKMPEDFLHEASNYINDLHELHIGFEQGKTEAICKFYFEQPSIKLGNNKTQLIHKAFKWSYDNADNYSLDFYYLPPVDSFMAIKQGVFSLVGKNAFEASLFGRVLDICRPEITLDEIFYLEIQSKSNNRRSFDIKLYDAEKSVTDYGEVIRRAGRHYKLPNTCIENFLDREGSQMMGHFSAGLRPDGDGFSSFYFGVKSC